MRVTPLIQTYSSGRLGMAFTKEDRAWRYSDSFEQGRWRVRKTIERLRRDAHASAERG